MTYQKCENCDGRGWTIYNTSPDGDKDVCHICEGTGKLPLHINDLEIDPADGLTYKCPKCGEYELRPEKIGRGDDFENYTNTGLWICDNPDCEAEFEENESGELKLQ